MKSKKSEIKKVVKKVVKKVLKKKVAKSKAKRKIAKVMHEFEEGKLHSGSKQGPVVHNPMQAVAIGYSEARRAKRKKK